jgi:hypothetical protein
MWTGSSAAALATIPVPITEVNQFGPTWRKDIAGPLERSQQARRTAGHRSRRRRDRGLHRGGSGL